MPVSAKMRAAAGKVRTARRRTARGSAMASINRAVGFNRGRQLVSIPAALRARSMMGGTELKSMDNGKFNQYASTLAGPGVPIQFTGAGTVNSLTYPIEGSSFYNRIGRRTRGVSLELHGIIEPTLTNTAATKAQYARIIIVYDRQSNGATPAVSDILLDYFVGGQTSTTSQSGLNMDNRDRFMILRDRKVLLPPLGISGVAPTTTATGLYTINSDVKESSFNYSEYIKLNGLETQYKSSTPSSESNIGDVATGGYLVVVIQEQILTTQVAWQLSFQTRLKFLD